MKSPADHKLINDVLAEAAPAGFQEALLVETLRLARCRRRTRQFWRASPLLLIGALVFYFHPHHAVIEKTPRTPVQIVDTQPLNPAAIIRTTPLAEGNRVSSAPGALIVHTKPGGGNYRLIGDEELLAFAAPRSAILIRLGPDSQTLIFTQPENASGNRPN